MRRLTRYGGADASPDRQAIPAPRASAAEAAPAAPSQIAAAAAIVPPIRQRLIERER